MKFLSSARAAPVLAALLPPFMALVLQRLLWPFMPSVLWLFFYPAVFASSWFGGLRAGMVAAALSVCLVWAAFLGPAESPARFLLPSLVFVSMSALLCLGHERMRRTDARLRALFELASDAIFVADLGGRYTDVNEAACRMLGYTREELLGKTIVDLIPAEDVGRLWQARAKQLDGGHERSEWLLRRKDGTDVPVEISANILPGGHWLASVRDISRRRAAEEESRRVELELDRSRRQLRAMAAHREMVREEERKHIAREIHDELGQLLMALKMDIARLRLHCAGLPDAQPAFADIAALIDRTFEVVRSTATSLRPGVLDIGLVPALEWLVEDFNLRWDINCRLLVEGGERPLGDVQSTAVFRTVQESLSNVARHARASEVAVTLSYGADSIAVKVRDDGCGFDPAHPPRSGGFGLMDMQERLIALNGQLRIESAAGAGTTVCIALSLPVEGAASAAG